MTNENETSCCDHTKRKCQIGAVTLPNRIIFPAWNLNYANPDGTISDKLHKFYVDLAEGGCGLIMTGNAAVTSDGLPFDSVMLADSDTCIPGLQRLFTDIKARGAVPGLQLVHFGRQSSTAASGDVLIAPSAIPCPVMSQFDPEYKVREMTLDDIAHIRKAFIAAAARGAQAGAEVIEVHAGHGYLLNEFLSPYSNHRTDAYGGRVENRARLIVEIIKGIRAALRDQVAISVRISGDEYVEGGLKPQDYAAIVPLFEQAGIDMLNVSAGVYASMEHILPPKSMGETPNLPMAEQIKAFTHVPLCVVGSIFSLKTAETILESGVADLCAMGRAQMSDPFIVRKSFDGQTDQIRTCIHCNACAYWATGDPYAYCAVNPDYKKPK